MKKATFRLIKEYPNSGKLGIIIRASSSINANWYRNYPEFYEEVFETPEEDLWEFIHDIQGNVIGVTRLMDNARFMIGDFINYKEDALEFPSEQNKGVKISDFCVVKGQVYVNSHNESAEIFNRKLSNLLLVFPEKHIYKVPNNYTQ